MSATEFAFELNQKVQLPTGDTGIVVARCDWGPYHKYLVIWWGDGRRNEDWLLNGELCNA